MVFRFVKYAAVGYLVLAGTSFVVRKVRDWRGNSTDNS